MANGTLQGVVGRAAGASLPVEHELLIGRNAAGAGRLGDDPELSRDHARVRRTDDGGLLIEDLGSTNGTRVNGAPITGPTLLRAGDQVQAGSTVIEVRGEPVALGPLPPIGRPRVPDRSEGRSATRRYAVVAVLLVLLAGAVTAVVATDRGSTDKARATTADFDGTLYI